MLALTVGRGHEGHEIYEYSIPAFSVGLKIKNGSDALNVSSVRTEEKCRKIFQCRPVLINLWDRNASISPFHFTLLQVMDALAIVAFVGAEHSVETQDSMQVIWQFIHSISSFKVRSVNGYESLSSLLVSYSLLLFFYLRK